MKADQILLLEDGELIEKALTVSCFLNLSYTSAFTSHNSEGRGASHAKRHPQAFPISQTAN